MCRRQTTFDLVFFLILLFLLLLSTLFISYQSHNSCMIWQFILTFHKLSVAKKINKYDQIIFARKVNFGNQIISKCKYFLVSTKSKIEPYFLNSFNFSVHYHVFECYIIICQFNITKPFGVNFHHFRISEFSNWLHWTACPMEPIWKEK